MKRTLGGSAITLVMVVACTVLAGTTLASASTFEGAESLNLRPLLLTIGQVPAGWTVNASSEAPDTADHCPRGKGLTKTQNVSASFLGSRGQQVVEELTTYSIAVEKAYRRVLVPLNGCDREKVLESHNKSGTAAVRRMSLPQFGNQSEAIDATWTEKGRTSNIYEVIIRSGNIVVTMAERGTGVPSIKQFEAFTRLAVARLPFGGTPPITTTTVPPATTTTVPPTTTTAPPPPTTTTTRPPPPVTTPTTAPVPVTAAPASCTPKTNSGGCYEPGEFCRDDDHGVTGVAGDGETITCEDNDGWRWEPA
jgi:hypothetical protein